MNPQAMERSGAPSLGKRGWIRPLWATLAATAAAVFVLMAIAFVLAALTTLPIRTERETADGEPVATSA